MPTTHQLELPHGSDEHAGILFISLTFISGQIDGMHCNAQFHRNLLASQRPVSKCRLSVCHPGYLVVAGNFGDVFILGLVE